MQLPFETLQQKTVINSTMLYIKENKMYFCNIKRLYIWLNA